MRAARVAQAHPATSVPRVPPGVLTQGRQLSRGRSVIRNSNAAPERSLDSMAEASDTVSAGTKRASPSDETLTTNTTKLSAKERYVVHTLCGYKIEGISVGGQETCIILPEIKLVFDSGRCPQRSVYADTMCLSHTHMDHVGGCGFYIATRSLLQLPPPTILLPASRAKAFEVFIDALRQLDGSDMPYNEKKMQPAQTAGSAFQASESSYRSAGPSGTDGESTALTEYRVSKTRIIRPFQTTHPVPSQGYVLYSTREKLKAEYIGKSGAEIKELKASGVNITDTVEVPEVAFTGDTTSDWIDRGSPDVSGVNVDLGGVNDELNGNERIIDNVAADALRAKLLICECTFVDDRCTVEDARKYGHTHLDELIAKAGAFRNEEILLIHFSARYKREEIENALQEKLQNQKLGKATVTPMVVGYA